MGGWLDQDGNKANTQPEFELRMSLALCDYYALDYNAYLRDTAEIQLANNLTNVSCFMAF